MNIVVVGGGTAGWLTALYAQHKLPEHKIILIESDKIGILSAGEGTAPNFLQILEEMGIPYTDLIVNCGSTIKNGIMFKNWNEENEDFFQPFLANLDTLRDPNLVTFDEGPINHALHFNAKEVAEFLRKTAESRGIERVEGIVDRIVVNNTGNISAVMLEDGSSVDLDFIFDASGFKHLIIGEMLGTKWISHEHILPLTKAIGFFLPQDGEFNAYTEAIAMDYGWMWKIPLQTRYGCGYAFDPRYISEEEAAAEIDRFVGFNVEKIKVFNFTPGAYEKIWVKNCLSIGLSGGFLEPLEATGLLHFVGNLQRFFNNTGHVFEKNQEVVEWYNDYNIRDLAGITDFIYTHYITNKTNTDFWTDFTKKNRGTETAYNIIDAAKGKVPLNVFENNKKIVPFASASEYTVFKGTKTLNPRVSEEAFYLLLSRAQFEKQEKKIIRQISHKDFLQEILNKTF